MVLELSTFTTSLVGLFAGECERSEQSSGSDERLINLFDLTAVS